MFTQEIILSALVAVFVGLLVNYFFPKPGGVGRLVLILSVGAATVTCFDLVRKGFLIRNTSEYFEMIGWWFLLLLLLFVFTWGAVLVERWTARYIAALWPDR